MNYFAHGIRFLNRPYFMAGTAVPDWLSVADRRVRMRSRRIEPILEHYSDSSPESEILRGVLQHLSDDDWFHTTPAFLAVTGQLALLFRKTLQGEPFLNGFLGHIVTELLIDATLIDQHPHRLDEYYDVMSQVDPYLIERVVNLCGRDTTNRLAQFITLFHGEAFLFDYRDSNRLLYRLNQVMHRVKLTPLPVQTLSVLDEGRLLVSQKLDELLPAEHFHWPP